jgi:hypothetical protein
MCRDFNPLLYNVENSEGCKSKYIDLMMPLTNKYILVQSFSHLQIFVLVHDFFSCDIFIISQRKFVNKKSKKIWTELTHEKLLCGNHMVMIYISLQSHEFQRIWRT